MKQYVSPADIDKLSPDLKEYIREAWVPQVGDRVYIEYPPGISPGDDAWQIEQNGYWEAIINDDGMHEATALAVTGKKSVVVGHVNFEEPVTWSKVYPLPSIGQLIEFLIREEDDFELGSMASIFEWGTADELCDRLWDLALDQFADDLDSAREEAESLEVTINAGFSAEALAALSEIQQQALLRKGT